MIAREKIGIAVAALLLVAAGACNTDKILEVSDPDVARPGTITSKEALPTIRAGAIADFGEALDGGNGASANEGQISLVGLLTDEYVNTETFPTRIEIDRRAQTIGNSTLANLFYDLQAARVSAARADSAYLKFDATNSGHSEVLSLEGLSLVLLAENYCGAVPLSSIDPATGKFVFGESQSTSQLLDSALVKANEALAISGVSGTSIGYLAQVLKGRALLDKGDFAGAAAAVAGVPTTFQYVYQHSTTTPRQNNGTWALTISVARFGEANNEGGNGLPYQSEGLAKNATFDPRVADTVRTLNNGHGFDNTTTQWMQMKYPSRTSNVVVADGVEARLIEAEAKLKAGDAVGALGILNALRAANPRGYAQTLPPLTLQGTPDAQLNQLFKERAYWLYLTAHRLGDMRRLIKQYGRNAESVFPTGIYAKGGTYGTDVNSPVPQAEQNNPKFNPSACVTTTP